MFKQLSQISIFILMDGASVKEALAEYWRAEQLPNFSDLERHAVNKIVNMSTEEALNLAVHMLRGKLSDFTLVRESLYSLLFAWDELMAEKQAFDANSSVSESWSAQSIQASLFLTQVIPSRCDIGLASLFVTQGIPSQSIDPASGSNPNRTRRLSDHSEINTNKRPRIDDHGPAYGLQNMMAIMSAQHKNKKRKSLVDLESEAKSLKEASVQRDPNTIRPKKRRAEDFEDAERIAKRSRSGEGDSS